MSRHSHRALEFHYGFAQDSVSARSRKSTWCCVSFSDDSQDQERQHSVRCTSCKQSIGAASNIDPEQVKLYKWEIRLRKDSSMTWGEHPEQKFISAQLLSMIESQGVRRFVVHDTDTSREDQEDDSTGILVSVASDDHESNKDSAKHK